MRKGVSPAHEVTADRGLPDLGEAELLEGRDELAGGAPVEDRRKCGVQTNHDFLTGFKKRLDMADAGVGAHRIVGTMPIAGPAKNAPAPDALDRPPVDLQRIGGTLPDATVALAAPRIGDAEDVHGIRGSLSASPWPR